MTAAGDEPGAPPAAPPVPSGDGSEGPGVTSGPGDGTQGQEAARGPIALLTDTTFGPFFAGSLVSNAGNWFQNLAASVVVYRLTGSNTLVGVVSVLQFTATLLLSPWAGVAGDRVDRRRLLILAQVVSFVGAASLALAVGILGVDGLGGPVPIYAATLVIGIGYAIGVPMIQALVPHLVRPGDLDGAIALSTVTFNLARAIGPALAGVLIAVAGAGAAFGVNAASFLIFIVVLLLIRPRPVEIDDDDDGDRSLRGGLRWARNDPVAVSVLLATLAIGWASDPVNTLTPAVADRFGHGDSFVGALVSAFGAGAAVTAVVVERIRRRLGGRRSIRLGFVLVGVGMVGLGLAPVDLLALASLALAGAGFLVALTSLNGAMQRRVPEALRGRVMALWSVALLGGRPFAALFDGSLADLTSVSVALCVVGIVPTAAGMVLLRKRQPVPG